MALKWVFPVIHLHMKAGILSSRTIVMNHQIMIAQHFGMGLHIIHDLLPQLRVSIFSQQRRDGLLCQLPAAMQDKCRHA